MRSLIMSIFNASTQKAVLLTCRRQQMWWRWAGGVRSARVVGRAISAVSLLFQSCCSACRKTNGGSCRFLLERLRTWKSSMPGAAPSSASASGYSGDPLDTWHNTNTNLHLLALCLSQSCVEQIMHRLGRRCTVHSLTETSCVYDSFELHSYKSEGAGNYTHI